RQRDHPRRAIGLGVLAFVGIIVLSSAHVWPSPGNLWLAAALAAAALVWWQLGPVERRGDPNRRALFPLALGGLLVVAGAFALLDLAAGWSVDWRLVLGAAVVATGAL